MKLGDNDFVLFGLPERFALDRADLDARWRALQASAHPDKFAAEGAAAQRVAMQWSVRINEAYQRLKDPQRRAAYLCELHGAPIDAHHNTAMPSEFLMQQMLWREALEDASGLEELDEISQSAHDYKRDALQKLEHLLDVDHNYAVAAGEVRALMFVEKFLDEVQSRVDRAELAGLQGTGKGQ